MKVGKIHLNPDNKVVEEVRKRVSDNDGYCPCALIHNEDTKCMCREFRESTESGPCHCDMYIKEIVNLIEKDK